MHPAERIVGVERQRPCALFVEHDPQRIQIHAVIDGPVEPPRLLGRHVGQRLDRQPEPRRLGLEVERGVRQLDLVGLWCDAQRLRPDVLVDDTALMELRERVCRGDRRPQPRLERERHPSVLVLVPPEGGAYISYHGPLLR